MVQSPNPRRPVILCGKIKTSQRPNVTPVRRKREGKCITEDCILREEIDEDKKTKMLAELVFYGNITFKVTQEAL